MEYVSLSQLAVLSGIPETSVRRYAAAFAKHFETRQFGRNIKYRQDVAVALLHRIYELYQTGYATREIEGMLSESTATMLSATVPSTSPPLQTDFGSFTPLNQPSTTCIDQTNLTDLIRLQAEEFGRLTTSLQALADRQKEILELKERLNKLEAELDERDFRLMKLIRSRQPASEKKGRRWWWLL